MDRMISGIKPTGNITLGNYIGAIREFVKYQDDYELFVFVADLHSLTIKIDPVLLKKNTENLVKIYLAAGLDPNKITVFKQSDVPMHNQLEWILTCNTNVAELTKMPQYKNYCDKNGTEAIPTGMLMYPSLMNADIILYDAKYVPVGEDQKPHVDLTRDIAERFNRIYGETFVLPKPILAKQGAKIMSLSDPTKKMSKSESDKGTIYILDDEKTIRNKIKKAITDSEFKIYYDPINKPGISNLLTIMSCLGGKTIEELELEFKDETNYGVFKNAVADVVCKEILGIQAKMNSYNNIGKILADGADKARIIANEKINEVYYKVGLR